MDRDTIIDEAANVPGHLMEMPLPEPDFEERGTDAQIGALYAALAAARGEFGEIRRSAEVKIDGKASYRFRYAPMDELLAAAVPALSKHGLCVLTPFMRTMGDVSKQLLILAHKEGGRLVFSFPFHAADDVKVFGGQTTYYQRYMYRSVLCLAADADLDEIPDAKKGETAATSPDRPRPTQAANSAQNARPAAPGGTSAPSARTGQTSLTPGGVPKTESGRSAPGEATDDGVRTQRMVAVDGAPKASQQAIDDLKAAARACGYGTMRDLSNRIYGVLWAGEVRSLGEPFLFGLTQDEADRVTTALVNEKAEKSAKTAAP